MSIWAEGYTLPHLGSPGKKIGYIPHLNYRFGKHADVFREEGSLTVPTSWERLGEMVTVDPDDHDNDVGSVVHMFQEGKVGSDGRPIPVASFVVGRLPGNLKSEAAGTTTLSGRGITSWALDRMRLRPFDHPRNPTRQPDWDYGAPSGPGLIQEGDFEDAYFSNGGFEEGNANQWQGTSIGPGFGSGFITAGQDSGFARTGDWYGLVTAFGNNGGARRSLSGLIEGEEYTITGWVRHASTGHRIRVGVGGVTEATHTNAYEADDIWWAELGNAPSGTGSSNGDWQSVTLTFIAASTSVEVVVVYVGGSAPQTWGIDDWAIEGLFSNIGGWRMRMFGAGTTTTVFTQTTDEAYEGVGSLVWKGFEGPHTSSTGQIQYGTLNPTAYFTARIGRMHTARLWVRHDGAGTEAMQLFIRRETPTGAGGSPTGTSWFLASITQDVPPDTWVEFQLSFEADVADLSLNIRYARTEDTDVGLIETALTYVDRVSVWEGLPAITVGDLWLKMLEGRASWLVPSFDADEDSNGDPWDKTRAFSLREGDTYGQIAEAITRLWGYVFRVRYDREANIYYLDIYNPGWVEFDHSTTDTGMLLVGSNITGGETVSREPEATTIRVVTDGGGWIEGTDTDLIAAWGEADLHVDAGIGSGDELADILARAQERNLEQMVTVEAEMKEHGMFIPLRDFDVFHKVGVNLGASQPIPITDMIVTSIVVSGKPGAPPDYQVYVNSDAFASTGAAALAEAVRRLLRRTQRRQEFFPAPAPQAEIVVGAGGGQFTVTVAAANASEIEKEKADVVIPDLDEDAVPYIQAAMEVGWSNRGGSFPNSGTVRFSSGTFRIFTPLQNIYEIGVKQQTLFSFDGQGKGNTILEVHLSFFEEWETPIHIAGDHFISNMTIKAEGTSL